MSIAIINKYNVLYFFQLYAWGRDPIKQWACQGCSIRWKPMAAGQHIPSRVRPVMAAWRLFPVSRPMLPMLPHCLSLTLPCYRLAVALISGLAHLMFRQRQLFSLWVNNKLRPNSTGILCCVYCATKHSKIRVYSPVTILFVQPASAGERLMANWLAHYVGKSLSIC